MQEMNMVFFMFGQLMVKSCSKIVIMENQMLTMVKLAEC